MLLYGNERRMKNAKVFYVDAHNDAIPGVNRSVRYGDDIDVAIRMINPEEVS